MKNPAVEAALQKMEGRLRRLQENCGKNKNTLEHYHQLQRNMIRYLREGHT